MKKIKVVNSKKKLIVDDEDYSRLSKHNWYVLDGYVYTYAVISHKPYARTVVRPQRMIMDILDPKTTVTFRNSNHFDCRRENLVVLDKSETGYTRRKPRGKWTSKYHGVCYRKNEHRWCAYINYPRDKKRHLGTFKTEIAAARARDAAALALWGDAARLNFPRRADDWQAVRGVAA
jgi:AP2 domain